MARILFVVAALCVLSIFAANPLVFELQKISNAKNRLLRTPYQGSNVYRRDQEVVQQFGGLHDGEFYMQLEVGTPSQKQFVQVDTATSNLAIYSSDCQGCRLDYGNGFNAMKSTSYKRIHCDDVKSTGYKCSSGCAFDVVTYPGIVKEVAQTPNICHFGLSVSGIEGDVGTVSTDIVKVKGVKPFGVDFGLVELLQGEQTDMPTTGSLGLGFAVHSFSKRTAFDSLLHDNRLYPSFSLCLQSSLPSLTIGQKPSAYSGFEWTDFEYPFYNVNVSSISVGGKTLNLNAPSLNSGGRTLIDSGSTVLGLNAVVWGAFKHAIAAAASNKSLVGYSDESADETIFDGYCYNMVADDVNQYPTVSIKLNNIQRSFDIKPQDYLIEQEGGVYCSQIVQSPVNHGNIFGAVFIQTSNIVFDRKKNRLGFGDKQTCGVSDKKRIKY